jgi:hypothetical protein
MTIQRQYSLPNCKLVVEGLGEEVIAPTGFGRPVLTRVINAECHMLGQEKPLAGGREFLESLSQSVSNYAQEFLSGVPHPHHSSQSDLVQLQRIDTNLHRLTVKPQVGGNGAEPAAPMQMDLRTVQLFDLVEAIDQLYADAQTLPDLGLKLTPVSRRYAVTHESPRWIVPAALGTASVAVAALALFFTPIPERRTEPTAETTPQTTTAVSPTPAASPPSPDSSPAVSPTPIAVNPTATPAASPEASPTATPAASPEASPTADADEELLNSAPTITDPIRLESLTRSLYDTLDQSWRTTPTFTEDLVYRVGVAENGDILGFRYVNQPALDFVKETPLLDLRYNPTDTPRREALAQFKVVFKPNGVLEISPWDGTPNQ